MCLYGDAEGERAFRAAWAKTGKKLEMGKSCLRFQSASDLALDVLGQAIARVPVDDYALRERARLDAKAQARCLGQTRRADGGGDRGG
jgi:hypothetical protein